MKLFKKLGELNTDKEINNFLLKVFCGGAEKCSTCPLNSTNRPYRDFWDDDDFCCLDMFVDVLTMDIKEENYNENIGSN